MRKGLPNSLLIASILINCVLTVLLVQSRSETALAKALLASVYSYPEAHGQDSGVQSLYLSAYRIAWLEFIVKSRIREDGNFESPGGQTFNKAVDDAHVEAQRLIFKLQQIPIQQRREAFLILQMGAQRELAACYAPLGDHDWPTKALPR